MNQSRDKSNQMEEGDGKANNEEEETDPESDEEAGHGKATLGKLEDTVSQFSLICEKMEKINLLQAAERFFLCLFISPSPHTHLFSLKRFVSVFVCFLPFVCECRTVVEVVFEEIHSHLNKTVKGSYEKPLLEKLVQWLHENVLAWLATIVYRLNDRRLISEGKQKEGGKETEDLKGEFLLQFTSFLQTHLFTSFSEIRFPPTLFLFLLFLFSTCLIFCLLRCDRINELFDIIVDYPDSKAALWDLKVPLFSFPLPPFGSSSSLDE